MPLSERCEHIRRRREQREARRLEREGHPPTDSLFEPINIVPEHVPSALLSTRSGLILIVGDPGSGKTTLLQHLCGIAHELTVPTWFFNLKDTPDTLPAFPFPFLTPTEACLTLNPPPDLTRDEWVHQIVLEMISTGSFLHGAVEIVRIAAEELGKIEGRDTNLADLYAALRGLKFGAGRYRQEGYRDSAVAELGRILTQSRGLFDGAATAVDWDDALTTSHGVYLGSVPAPASRLYAFLRLRTLLDHRLAHHQGDRSTRQLVIMDDARLLVTEIRGPGTAGVPGLLDLVDRGQHAGIALFIALQGLASAPDWLLSAAGTTCLIGPQRGEDLRRLRAQLSLSREQEAALIKQPPHHALLQTRLAPDTRPVVTPLPGPEYLPPEDETRRVAEAHRPRLLARWTPMPVAAAEDEAATSGPTGCASGTASSDAPRLPANQHSLLLSVLQHPERYQKEHGDAVGLKGRALSAAVKALATGGLLKIHRLNRYTLLEASPEGAACVGCAHRPLKGRGSYAHRWLQFRIRAHLAPTHAAATVEHDVPDGRLDVYARTADGRERAFEICLGTSGLDKVMTKLGAFRGETTIVVENLATKRRIGEKSASRDRSKTMAVRTVDEMVRETRCGHAATSGREPAPPRVAPADA